MKIRSLSALVVSSILFISSCKLDPPVYPGQPGYVDTAPKSGGSSSGSGSSTGSGSNSTGSGSSGSGTGTGSNTGTGAGSSGSTGSGSSSGTGSSSGSGTGSGTSTNNAALTGTWVLTKSTYLYYINGALQYTQDDPTGSGINSQITLDDKAKTGTYQAIGGDSDPVNYQLTTSSGKNYITFADYFFNVDKGLSIQLVSVTSTSLTWQFVMDSEKTSVGTTEIDVKEVFTKK